MLKEKLKIARTNKGFTQKQIADVLPIDISNYCRKEKGEIKITMQEWEKMAKFMNVPLEEIYEEDEPKSYIKIDNSTLAENSANINSNNYNIPKYLQEYIEMLKEEIKNIKSENQFLKSQK